MHSKTCTTLAATLLVLIGTHASARERATVARVDAATVELDLGDTRPTSIWISRDARLDRSDQRVAIPDTSRTIRVSIPASERRYLLLKGPKSRLTVVSERLLPLEHGSNFRDVGGYVTQDGHTVRWGKAFRSGALPLLTEGDYALIQQLAIGTVVDFRSLEEREVAGDLVDDRTGALFIANDYSLKTLMANARLGNGENAYRGMEKLLVPQYRSLFRRLIADDGAVIYHCSAGQDRTGIATALLYDVLGVDRETILKDYHLSTLLRRPEWEMPEVDPKDYPNNPIVRYYFARPKDQRGKAEPLYAPSGTSHLAQFFSYIDQEYGGAEGYMKKALGFEDKDMARLREVMLD